MKIKFPDNSDGSQAVVTLCGQGKDEGNFVGTVPMTFTPAAGMTRTGERLVKVSSSTSINRRGVRSGVVKVTMPYEALLPDGNGGYVPDPSRSGAEISVHLVVALPATAATDIRSSDAKVGDYAQLQIAAVAHLLGVLLQGLIATPLVQNSWADGKEQLSTALALPTATKADPDANVIDLFSAGESLIGLGGIGFAPTADAYQVNGGLQGVFNGTPPKAVSRLIQRIARSLPALAGCEDIDVVHYQVHREPGS